MKMQFLKRAWTLRDARKRYLGVRMAELETRTKETSILIDKIRAAMFKDALLYVRDSNATEESAPDESAMTPSGKPLLLNM